MRKSDLEVETFRQLEVQLAGGALEGASHRVNNMDVNLGACTIKRTTAW